MICDHLQDHFPCKFHHKNDPACDENTTNRSFHPRWSYLYSCSITYLTIPGKTGAPLLSPLPYHQVIDEFLVWFTPTPRDSPPSKFFTLVVMAAIIEYLGLYLEHPLVVTMLLYLLQAILINPSDMVVPFFSDLYFFLWMKYLKSHLFMSSGRKTCDASNNHALNHGLWYPSKYVALYQESWQHCWWFYGELLDQSYYSYFFFNINHYITNPYHF